MTLWAASFKTSSDTPCEQIKSGTLILKKNHNDRIENFCACDYLTLKVKKIAFSKLPPCLFRSDLRSLHFDGAVLDEFPEDILNVPELESLTIKNAELDGLPEELSKLRSLRYLDIRGTSVKALPDGLDHLKRIDMRNIDIDSERQKAIRHQYPETRIFFSSPCNCN
jgi:Leucine-rich repeat (LRR) protein